MKKVLTKFFPIGCMVLLMLSSCKKDGALVTSNGGKAGTLVASATTLPLDKTKVNDTSKVIHFTFNAANFGFSAAVTNTLQIDVPGDNWANPTSVTLPNKVYSMGYSTADFNSIVLKLNLPAGVASMVNVRVAHSLSAKVTPVYSNVLSLTVTPFNLTSWLYITGAFAGWQNPGPLEDSLVSVTGNGIYTGIINFPAAGGVGGNEFLILPAKNWNNKYATTETATPSTTVTYNAGNNLKAPEAGGYFLVTFNLNTGGITFTPANYYSIIGDAAPGVAWTTDSDLKPVNDGSGTWVGTFTFTTGSFKVRQNHDWTFSWGVPKAGSEGAGIPATLNDTSNDNIGISTAGSHTVTFTIPTTAAGTTPAVTAGYSVN